MLPKGKDQYVGSRLAFAAVMHGKHCEITIRANTQFGIGLIMATGHTNRDHYAVKRGISAQRSKDIKDQTRLGVQCF